MSLDSVRADLAAKAPDLHVVVLDTSTATVPLAAAALGVEPGRIAKTLSLRIGERVKDGFRLNVIDRGVKQRPHRKF